jgi:hypothetical protein
MSDLIDLCSKIFIEETKKVDNIKLEYSYTQKILIVFTNNYLYVIDNSKNIPNQIAKMKINFQIKYTTIHPKNQNQLLIITNNEKIYLIKDLKSFNKLDQLKELNINAKNIISIKFSYFDNYFGILFDMNKFSLYYINSQSQEQLMKTEELDTNYIDFNFCPQFSLGFDMFMIFFMTNNGELNMYGPFFPEQFMIKKEFFFNMNNFLIYKLNTMQNDDSDYQKYAISLAIIDDLKKSIINELKDDYEIKISEKIKIVNATFKKKEILINNNFITNTNKDISNVNYKQIYILEKRPLTILRISENNNIDIIMISDEIFLELASTGNITSRNNITINNYLIEYIQLNQEKKISKDLFKIIQYENEQLFLKSNDNLYLIRIPYLNELKKAVEDNIMFIPNKMKKTSITKLLKWDNNKNKVIKINDILIIPDLYKLYIFSIIKDKMIVKDYDYNNIINETKIAKFKDIFKEEKKENYVDDILNIKLNENNSIKNEMKNIKININEKLLEDKNNNNFQFEQKLNNDMKNFYKIYNNLLQKNEQINLTKINIMKNVYNNLSKSKIKENIDETIKKIIGLNTLKERILKNNEIISKKIDSIKEKINKYELTDEETENYLKILEKYQKELSNKLNDIERKINFYDEYIGKTYAFKGLFPKNDLAFNLLEKENQKNYMKLEEEINNKSKELYINKQE